MKRGGVGVVGAVGIRWRRCQDEHCSVGAGWFDAAAPGHFQRKQIRVAGQDRGTTEADAEGEGVCQAGNRGTDGAGDCGAAADRRAAVRSGQRRATPYDAATASRAGADAEASGVPDSGRGAHLRPADPFGAVPLELGAVGAPSDERADISDAPVRPVAGPCGGSGIWRHETAGAE